MTTTPDAVTEEPELEAIVSPEPEAAVDEHAGAVVPAGGVCAVLFVEKCKMRQVKVAGASGAKYTFSWSNDFRGLVRQYTNVADFMREEQDMRLSRRSQFVITTRLGAPHPAVAAEDALEELLNDHRRVQLHVLEPCLVRIIERARGAVEAIEASRHEPEPEKQPAPEQVPAMGEVVALPAQGWVETATGLPDIDAPMATTEQSAGVPQVDVPSIPKGGLGHENLMRMGWNQLKQLAAEKGVEVGKVPRDTLAIRFLEAQAKGFPNERKGGA